MAAEGGPSTKSQAVQYDTVGAEEFDDVTTLLDDQRGGLLRERRGWFERVRHSLFGCFTGFQRLDDGFADSSGVRRDPCPEENASLWSSLLFLYINGLMHRGYVKHLEPEDLDDLPHESRAGHVADHFERKLNSTREMVEAPQGRVLKALWRAYWQRFMLAGFIKLVHDIVMLSGPYILEQLLYSIQEDGPRHVGLMWALALFAIGLADTLSINQYFYILFKIGLHTKTSIIHMLYRKSLRISSATRTARGVGSILNLQSNDAAKLWNAPQYLHMLWGGPFQILVIMFLLVRVLGLWPSLAGLGVTIFLIPLNTIVSKRVHKFRRGLLKHTDKRVKLVTEVITGIKAIKLYAWEAAYMERISTLRKEEMAAIRRVAKYNVVNAVFFFSGPVLVSMAAFATYTVLGNDLTAPVAFPALALFNLMRFPILMLPMQITNLINGRVALRRIQDFMNEDEMEQPPPSMPARQGRPAIKVENGAFSWEPAAPAFLKGINFEVPTGSLLMVVGKVGSGKTSLLSALLGEMSRRTGTVTLAGNVAYTAQDPWIRNKTLRENVLMGSPDDEEWYNKVIEACALQADIAMLPGGDSTEIGEKGINLSGGQKHRTALARAVYAASDVYLLDDPLSAVDAHVGSHLFHKCVCGLLAGRTRVLVTHQLQFLRHADLIAVMENGSITHYGTYAELAARGVDFTEYAHEDEEEEEGEGAAPVETADGASATPQEPPEHAGSQALALNAPPPPAAAPLPAAPSEGIRFADEEGDEEGDGSDDDDGKGESTALVITEDMRKDGFAHVDSKLRAGDRLALLVSDRTYSTAGEAGKVAMDGGTPKLKEGKSGALIKTEERAKGSVKRTVYLTYLRSWGPWFWMPLAVLCAACGERGLQVSQNIVLSFWSANTVEGSEDGGPARSSSFYLMIFFTLGLSSLGMVVCRALLNIRSTTRAAMKLYMELQDKVMTLPMSFFDTQPTGRLLNRFTKDTEALDSTLSQSISSFMTTCTSSLFSVLVVLTISPGVIVPLIPLALLYRSVQRYYIATSRELKRLDSLAFSPIFGHFGESLNGLLTVRAFRKQMAFLEANEAMLDASNRVFWPVSLVNRWLSVRLEMFGNIIIFGTAFFVTVVYPPPPEHAGLAGLALTSALNLTGIMNWMVRQTSEMEVNMNSVERMVEYIKEDSEAPAVIQSYRPPPSWPHAGVIEVKNLVVRYRPELDPVLKGISFTVNGREKIGVCGRTGCGKSTLMMTLYRIVEPAEGSSIVIDGVDVLAIGLRDLRSRLSLVPQDPVIFSGTVRSNLDPFDETASDDAIWDALRAASMEEYVRGLEGGLDASITEGGANLSVGQRQLLCMARAMLRKTRILVLDEATSNVDNATDSLIQRTVREGFATCTVLTIAHRLHTIIDSDRIMLLDAGNLAEFDTPHNLLADPSTQFAGLVAGAQAAGNMKHSQSAAALAEKVERALHEDA